MDTAVLPIIVLSLAPESLKNTYLATLGMGGLLVAAIMQPLVGRVSDRTRSPFGRRVPYILFGTTVVCGSLVLLALAPNLAALFAVWMFIQANLNIAYGPGMALIRDLVPRDRIGVASSIKILMDAIGGLTLITASAALIGLATSAGLGPVQVYVDWEWAVFALLGAALAIAVAITCMMVLSRDPRRRVRPVRPADAPPSRVLNRHLVLFLGSRLLLMTAIYAFPNLRPVLPAGRRGGRKSGPDPEPDDTRNRGIAGGRGLPVRLGLRSHWTQAGGDSRRGSRGCEHIVVAAGGHPNRTGGHRQPDRGLSGNTVKRKLGACQ